MSDIFIAGWITPYNYLCKSVTITDWQFHMVQMKKQQLIEVLFKLTCKLSHQTLMNLLKTYYLM